MNFFSHGLPFLEDPYYLAGTAVPDWMCVADRGVRVRLRHIERVLGETAEEQQNSPAACLARGARQHLQDDDWFHRQRSFTEVSTDLARLFRQAIGPDDNFRAGFLGHIVTEMLLDRVLIEQQPDLLEEYYRVLSLLDPVVVESAVNEISTGETVRLAPLIPRFLEERFLFDYLNHQKLLFRLNQVMRRVKLPVLPASIEHVLEECHHCVQARHTELLPEHVLKAALFC